MHLDLSPDLLPDDYLLLTIDMRDLVAEGVTALPADPAAFGDAWLASGATLGLVAPSGVLSIENNLILNPLHAEMRTVRILETSPFRFDDRLFKR